MITKLKTTGIILASIFVICTTGLFVSQAFGAQDQNALDRARIEQIKREIDDNIRQYARLVPQKTANEQRCSLAQDQIRQLTALNAANNAKRSELSFLESKFPPQTPTK